MEGEGGDLDGGYGAGSCQSMQLAHIVHPQFSQGRHAFCSERPCNGSRSNYSFYTPSVLVWVHRTQSGRRWFELGTTCWSNLYH